MSGTGSGWLVRSQGPGPDLWTQVWVIAPTVLGPRGPGTRGRCVDRVGLFRFKDLP